jgi:hypothetical protein
VKQCESACAGPHAAWTACSWPQQLPSTSTGRQRYEQVMASVSPNVPKCKACCLQCPHLFEQGSWGLAFDTVHQPQSCAAAGLTHCAADFALPSGLPSHFKAGFLAGAVLRETSDGVTLKTFAKVLRLLDPASSTGGSSTQKTSSHCAEAASQALLRQEQLNVSHNTHASHDSLNI